jgi:glycosyltransferase involved in cell wall biosynthesis
MPAKERVSIIIPFYDEGKNVGRVLGELRRTNQEVEIIAFNEGNRDGTEVIILSHAATCD